MNRFRLLSRLLVLIFCLNHFSSIGQNTTDLGSHIVSDTLFNPNVITDGWSVDSVYQGAKAGVYFLDCVKYFEYSNNNWQIVQPASIYECIHTVPSYQALRTIVPSLLCDIVYVKNFQDTVNGQLFEIIGGQFVKDTIGTENFGTIIKSQVGNTVWRRIHDGVIIPDWWENMNDSKKIQAAVGVTMNYGEIHFQPRTYEIENDIYIDSLQHVIFDGQKATLRAAHGSLRNTSLASAYSEGSTNIEVTNVPLSWKKGDILVLATNNTNAGTSGRSQIDTIIGNSIQLFFPFTSQEGGNLPSQPAGINVVKNISIFRGRPSATEGTTDAEGANKGVIIENFIFDGNKQGDNTVSLSWSVNHIISLHGRGAEIRSCRFINAPSEVILGHGLNVHDNVFRDCNGSALHLSAHDFTFEESFPSYFQNNTVINCNTTPYAISGHNEGIISFSWNGGYSIISNNYFIAGANSTGVIGSLEGYGQPNDREIVILANNYCKGFQSVVYGSHQTSTRSLQIIGNIFEDCLNLMPTIRNDLSVKICGNVQVGTTNFGISFRNSCEYQTIVDNSLGIGKNSLLNTTTNFNTAIGHYSMQNTTTGDFNVALGTDAFKNNTTGSRNMAIGTWTGLSMIQGNDNTMIGHWSRGSSTGGNNNVHIGVESGRTNNGSGNVFIGYKAGVAYSGNNNLVIHNNDTSPPLIEGKFDDGITVNGDLRIGGVNYLRLPRIAVSQRNTLTGLIGGEIIFNTTFNKIQIFDGAYWIDLY